MIWGTSVLLFEGRPYTPCKPKTLLEIFSRCWPIWKHSYSTLERWATTTPNSASKPRMRLVQAVRYSFSPSRSRCMHSMPCWETVLMATKRMVGREAASQIAAASLASFLPWSRYGLTRWAAMIRASRPRAMSLRAQWWPLELVSRGCKNFCVNGQLAGNCCTSRKKRNDRKQRTDRQPADELQET